MDNPSNDNRPFPIQQGHHRDASGAMQTDHACTVPWWLAEVAYEWYHKRYPGQSLEQLAARGGFGREELIGPIRREL